MEQDIERSMEPADRPAPSAGAWPVFLVFLRLGCTSFGGPVAHIGYFHDEFVRRRRWLSERSFVDLVALCQVLPGPSSSQVGLAIGMTRGGLLGALAAWLGFTLPSALMLMLFAVGLKAWGAAVPAGALHGLKVVAVAVVAQAVWSMARKLCAGAVRALMALLAAAAVLLWPTSFAQLGTLVIAGGLGMALFEPAPTVAEDELPVSLARRTGGALLALFATLLVGAPLLLRVWPDHALAVATAFYRTGSLVFGGGHVVLPMLQTAVVEPGWVANESFLAGYGLTQAMPGPLFTFAAFLGASMQAPPTSWAGGALCLVAIFLPSLLLVFGALPFWATLRTNRHVQSALTGVNAAVVGLLLAALCRPVWTSAVFGLGDVCFVLLALAALMAWRLPPWLVVVVCAAAGWLLASI
jgi:chromate transporter